MRQGGPLMRLARQERSKMKSRGWAMTSYATLLGAALVSGCNGPSETFCLLYNRVPLTVADVDSISQPALRAIETNERITDRLCR